MNELPDSSPDAINVVRQQQIAELQELAESIDRLRLNQFILELYSAFSGKPTTYTESKFWGLKKSNTSIDGDLFQYDEYYQRVSDPLEGIYLPYPKHKSDEQAVMQKMVNIAAKRSQALHAESSPRARFLEARNTMRLHDLGDLGLFIQERNENSLVLTMYIDHGKEEVITIQIDNQGRIFDAQGTCIFTVNGNENKEIWHNEILFHLYSCMRVMNEGRHENHELLFFTKYVERA